MLHSNNLRTDIARTRANRRQHECFKSMNPKIQKSMSLNNSYASVLNSISGSKSDDKVNTVLPDAYAPMPTSLPRSGAPSQVATTAAPRGSEQNPGRFDALQTPATSSGPHNYGTDVHDNIGYQQGGRSFSNGNTSMSSQTSNVFVGMLDDSVHAMRKAILEAYELGLADTLERERVHIAKDYAVLSEKHTVLERDYETLKVECQRASAGLAGKTETCARMADLIGLLKHEKRDALMMHRLLSVWKRNARLEASHLRVVGTVEGAHASLLQRRTFDLWRIAAAKKLLKSTKDGMDAVIRQAKDENFANFVSERERFIAEIDSLRRELSGLAVKERTMKDQMKQAFLRGINALTDEATSALEQTDVPVPRQLGDSSLTASSGDATALLSGPAQQTSTASPARGAATVAYPDQSGCAAAMDACQGDSKVFAGFDNDQDAGESAYTAGIVGQTRRLRNTMSIDTDPLNMTTVQQGYSPGQAALPIKRSYMKEVVPVDASRRPYEEHVHTTASSVPVYKIENGPIEYKTTDPLSKRLRAINSVKDHRKESVSTAMYHENLSGVQRKIVISKN